MRFLPGVLLAVGSLLDLGCAKCTCLAEALDDPDAVVVNFGTVEVGASQTMTIPIRNSSKSDQTITMASLEGAGAAAFQVSSAFPVKVSAGDQISLTIEFSPIQPGLVPVELDLDTTSGELGIISVQGTGAAPDGG